MSAEQIAEPIKLESGSFFRTNGYGYRAFHVGSDPWGTLVIHLPGDTPTLNSILSSLGRMQGWKARKIAADRLKKRYAKELAIAIPGVRAFPHLPARLTILSRRWNLADHDGFVGGAKYLIDALVKRGVLVDDSLKWIRRPNYEQLIDRKNRRTEIVVEYLRTT